MPHQLQECHRNCLHHHLGCQKIQRKRKKIEFCCVCMKKFLPYWWTKFDKIWNTRLEYVARMTLCRFAREKLKSTTESEWNDQYLLFGGKHQMINICRASKQTIHMKCIRIHSTTVLPFTVLLLIVIFDGGKECRIDSTEMIYPRHVTALVLFQLLLSEKQRAILFRKFELNSFYIFVSFAIEFEFTKSALWNNA